MIIFAIESSHDDTSFAILDNNKPIWMKTLSQTEIHKKYGGTIPEIAARLHVTNIGLLLEELKNLNYINKLNYIAYTKEPGLIGSLQVGYIVAKALSLVINKPIIPINHLEGHFYSAFIEKEIVFPALGLIVSGGHTQLVLYKSNFDYQILGETLDDAVGEVYDKVARKLDLWFPGGPVIDNIWAQYSGIYKEKYKLPITHNELDFSFSGLKTKIINLINNDQMKKKIVDVHKYSTIFQNTVIDYLKNKMKLAIKKYKPNCLVLAGGVSANKGIRSMFLKLHKNVFLAKMEYTTDNAMMIARVALEKIKNN